MTPAQPGEARIVATGRDPLAPRFDRERGQVGVRHQLAPGTAITHQAGEDPPVTTARRDPNGMRRRPDRVHERKSGFGTAGSCGTPGWVPTPTAPLRTRSLTRTGLTPLAIPSSQVAYS